MVTVETDTDKAIRRSQRLASYRPAESLERSCGVCRYFLADHNGCQLVAGQIGPDMVCNLFEGADANGELEYVEFARSFDIAKTDDAKQYVFGWANVSIRKDGEQVQDYHQDLIDPEDLEEAAYGFVLEFRETGEMHGGTAKGRVIESVVFTPEKLEKMKLEPDALPVGWWVGFHVEDSDAYRKVRSGEYKMFSIQGRALREEVA